MQVAAGGRLALRVHRYGYHDRVSLQSELTWMRALAMADIATPTVVPTPAGDVAVEVTSEKVSVPHLCDMLEWVEGRPLGSANDPGSLGRGATFGTYRRVGRMAARIHRHSATWQAPEGFVRPHWDREGCLARAALWGPWFDLDVLDSNERQVLGAAAAVLDRTLVQFGKDRAEARREVPATLLQLSEDADVQCVFESLVLCDSAGSEDLCGRERLQAGREALERALGDSERVRQRQRCRAEWGHV
ncbi:MAG: hypothetical protein ABI859_08450 [Pseudomonadota bacterium]